MVVLDSQLADKALDIRNEIERVDALLFVHVSSWSRAHSTGSNVSVTVKAEDISTEEVKKLVVEACCILMDITEDDTSAREGLSSGITVTENLGVQVSPGQLLVVDLYHSFDAALRRAGIKLKGLREGGMYKCFVLPTFF